MKPQRRALIVNGFLVLAALTSVALVVLTDRAWTTAELSARAEHLVVGFRSHEVRRFTITEGDKTVIVERDGEVVPTQTAPTPEGSDAEGGAPAHRWVVREPFQGEAEEAAADALLRAVEFATVLRAVPEPSVDRAAFGLDQPERVIELELGESKTRLRFGAAAPSPEGARYVEVAGEGTRNKGVFVISRTTAEELHVAPDEFRIRQLIPYAASKLRSVTLLAAGVPALELKRQRDVWTVQMEGQWLRLEAAARERLFTAFARSHADLILPSEFPHPSELTAEQVEVQLTPMAPGAQPLRLRFGGPCPDDPQLELALRLSPDPLAACVKPLFIRSFIEEAGALVDTALFSFLSNEVEQWRIMAPDQTLEVARRENGWWMRQPQQGRVEAGLGNARLESLLELRGELSSPPEGFELRSTVITDTGGETEEQVRTERVEVYLPPGSSATVISDLYVKRLQDSAWLKLPPHALHQLTPDALLLKDTQLSAIDAKQFSSFTVTTPQWSHEVEVREERCSFRRPEGMAMDQALCQEAIEALGNLRARAWVSEGDTGKFGLQTPRVQATWQTGSEQAALTIGERSPDGGYYARVASEPAVFTVSRSMVDTLTTLLLDRSPFMLQPEDVRRLTLLTSQYGVALRRLGQSFVQTPLTASHAGRAEIKLSPGQIEALVDALSFVRPEAAVAMGAGTSRAAQDRRYGFDRPLLRVLSSDGTGWVVGAGDIYRDVSIYYARLIGGADDAVFALPRQSVQRILDVLSE